MAAIRILRKDVDLVDQFVPKVKGLLTEKNHGVLITGASLMIEMCKLDPKVIEGFRKMVPHLVRVFSSLLQYGFSPEYDVGGVTDPFLQVKILRLLRLLGENNAEASDQMNVVLAGVATNTDNVRNVGNSILYECVNTIMGIDSEAGLRVLAINTLGKFLAHRDNNIRYVALNTLCTVVNIDTEAVQRHRNTVVDCLKDNDISIRRRALELVYSLVNSSNVRVLVRELVNFLQIADIEFRPDLTAKLCIVAEKYAPTPRWQIDTILRVMTISGDHVPDSTSNALLALISQTPDIQAYAVQRMYIALQSDFTQQTLVRTAVWCIGEFGDLLLNPANPAEPRASAAPASSGVADLLADLGVAPPVAVAPAAAPLATSNEDDDISIAVRITEQDLMTLFKSILSNIATKTSTKRQVLTAALKLTTHMPRSAIELRALIAQYETHINAELQQRATEYEHILDIPSLPNKLLMRIPAPEVKAMTAAIEEPKKAPRPSKPALSSSSSTTISTPVKQAAAPVNLLDMDLMTLSPSAGQPILGGMLSNGGENGGAVGGGAAPSILEFLTATGTAPVVAQPAPSSAGPIDLLNTLPTIQPSGSPIPSLAPSGSPGASWNGIPAFKTLDGLVVTFDLSKPQPASPQFTLAVANYANQGSMHITDIELKLSLPKYLKMQVMPISPSTSLSPLTSASQQIKLANTMQGQKPLMMRLRLEYKANGEPKAELGEPQLPENI